MVFGRANLDCGSWWWFWDFDGGFQISVICDSDMKIKSGIEILANSKECIQKGVQESGVAFLVSTIELLAND